VSSSLFTASRTISVGSDAMPSLLGNPALEFKSLDGTEALGQLFEYTVRLQTPDSPMLTEYVTANVPSSSSSARNSASASNSMARASAPRRARALAPARSTAW
jgi:type VI secretion system secreted protein VgrG